MRHEITTTKGALAPKPPCTQGFILILNFAHNGVKGSQSAVL